MMLKLVTDHNQLRQSLEGVGHGSGTPEGSEIADAVIAVSITLDSFSLSDSAKKAVLEILTSEGSKDLREASDGLTGKVWRDFDYGNVKIGDYVRVKQDAYQDNTGARHNGLVGKLVSMRSGRCTVQYIGMATGSRISHPKEFLESLKVV